MNDAFVVFVNVDDHCFLNSEYVGSFSSLEVENEIFLHSSNLIMYMHCRAERQSGAHGAGAAHSHVLPGV